MGHSYIEYGGNEFLARDSKIEWLCQFLLEERNNRLPNYKFTTSIDRLFEWWDTDEAFPGPGCINMKLDDFITDKITQEQMFSLLNGVKRTVASYGKAIPVDEMNRRCGYTVGGYMNEMPVPPMLEFLSRVRRLIENRKFT